jgi:hypothetical protein
VDKAAKIHISGNLAVFRYNCFGINFTGMKLSLAQKIAKALTSAATFEKLKEESIRYYFVCASCKKESNIWEIGGIKYKAAGKPLTGIKCPGCGKFAMQRILKKEQ